MSETNGAAYKRMLAAEEALKSAQTEAEVAKDAYFRSMGAFFQEEINALLTDGSKQSYGEPGISPNGLVR